MLEMRHAGKVYPGGAVALEDINVHISPGEFVFLVGPSGAGKSTFIRLISREIEPTSGQILVDGVDVMKLKRGIFPISGGSWALCSRISGCSTTGPLTKTWPLPCR